MGAFSFIHPQSLTRLYNDSTHNLWSDTAPGSYIRQDIENPYRGKTDTLQRIKQQ